MLFCLFCIFFLMLTIWVTILILFLCDEFDNTFVIMQKSSVTSNEIPVTHWKPILNFHVLNEKVEFERQAIPSEVYPFIRYDGHSSNVDKKILECVYQKCTSMFSYKWSPSDRLWHLVEEKTFGKRKKNWSNRYTIWQISDVD